MQKRLLDFDYQLLARNATLHPTFRFQFPKKRVGHEFDGRNPMERKWTYDRLLFMIFHA